MIALVPSFAWRDITLIMTTTPNIEGKSIAEYLGVCTGEAIMGANIFKDMFAGIRDIVGGRSASYEKELRKARSIALQENWRGSGQTGRQRSGRNRYRL